MLQPTHVTAAAASPPVLTSPAQHNQKQIREQSRLLEKVKVVGGDISLPGLGLSVSDRATLVSSVNIIVHCAADIRLEADIQVRWGRVGGWGARGV